MTAARTITFTLNGAPVTADVKPHHNLVELLQTALRPHRRARELRPGPVRLLHRPRQRQARCPAASISRCSSTAPR